MNTPVISGTAQQPTLRQIRNTLGWTQERMAKELGTSLRSYARWEANAASPRGGLAHATLIAKAHTPKENEAASSALVL